MTDQERELIGDAIKALGNATQALHEKTELLNESIKTTDEFVKTLADKMLSVLHFVQYLKEEIEELKK